MKILLTGFEPFGEHEKNSSELVLDFFKDHEQIQTKLLPVEYENAFKIVSDLMDQTDFNFVIHLGQAAGRSKISLERVAINVCDFPIDDNKGVRIVDEPIIKEADAAYFSTLPIRELEKELSTSGVPCEISNTAGAYICNEIMYRSLHKSFNQKTSVGFIHLPLMTEESSKSESSQLCLSQLVHGIELILKYLLKL
ncbi:hypothetical protein A9Q84_01450 [Halobacteriovorax marinus]|uniref:Pyroglutamyl-peptidase I n=1 Tax=Halobacteriovorax marinus TaxID=97084 RepID=A0A1Y5FG40_9BACT|nr:hypothetical protein A9Q84_01450 [Halobacteriovorax marinus]